MRNRTLVGMAVAGTLSSDGQVSEGVEVPSEGGAGREGEVGDGHLKTNVKGFEQHIIYFKVTKKI
jgi:hypothetical protein